MLVQYISQYIMDDTVVATRYCMAMHPKWGRTHTKGRRRFSKVLVGHPYLPLAGQTHSPPVPISKHETSSGIHTKAWMQACDRSVTMLYTGS